jgi:hypothetical protein
LDLSLPQAEEQAALGIAQLPDVREEMAAAAEIHLQTAVDLEYQEVLGSQDRDFLADLV